MKILLVTLDSKFIHANLAVRYLKKYCRGFDIVIKEFTINQKIEYILDEILADELGYKTIFWSLAYVDWYKDDQPTKEQAFSKLIPRIHPGAVVLLHSTSDTNEMILDELLTKWKDLGYTFKTLDDLTAN
jgi:hypothetical protein